MGYVAHDMVVVTTWRSKHEWPDIDGFRESLPQEWRGLVVGPIPSVVNGDVTWVFAPDGSKSGWATDEEGDRYRNAFIDLFTQNRNYGFDVVVLRYGADFRYDHPDPEAVYVEVSEDGA